MAHLGYLSQRVFLLNKIKGMNIWEIAPFKSIGILHFGQSRREVRELLGEGFKSFHRGQEPTLTDFYTELGLLLYYDKDDRLEFVEVVRPCNVIFNGISLLENDLQAVLTNLLAQGYEPMRDETGFKYESLGFWLYTPFHVIEAVSVFPKGYYE